MHMHDTAAGGHHPCHLAKLIAKSFREELNCLLQLILLQCYTNGNIITGKKIASCEQQALPPARSAYRRAACCTYNS
jgi:hypothetical protein